MEEEPLSSFHFPPGFRFHPSDEELIVHYLLNKVNSRRLPASIIAEIELYNFNPWELPKKALFGENEWYFFSPRDRKYPNGERPNRTAASGFWKATGTDKPIRSSMMLRIIGVKKALVFYTGRPPNGSKTEWIMNEYRLPETRSRSSKLKGSMRLDDWVLCRVRKKGNTSKNAWEVKDTPSKSAVYLPKLQELPISYTKTNANIITDRLFKEFQVMASILAGQGLPPIEAISSGAFQGTKQSNNNSLVYNINPGATNTMNSWFDPSKNKVHEGNRFNNVVKSTMMITEVKESEDLLDTNFYGNQSKGDIYNLNHSGTVINLAELNGSSFLGRSIQLPSKPGHQSS